MRERYAIEDAEHPIYQRKPTMTVKHAEIQKTHFADDDTLAYISRLERDRAELIAALRECAAALNCEPDADACAGQKASALLSRLGAE